MGAWPERTWEAAAVSPSHPGTPPSCTASQGTEGTRGSSREEEKLQISNQL